MRYIAFRDIGIFFYLVPFRFAATFLPVGAVRVLGNVMGYVYSMIAVERKRRTSQRLRTALGASVSDSEIKTLARRSVLNAVACYVDALIVHRIRDQELRSSGRVSGLEHLEKALSKGKGVVLVTGHFTGIKMASWFLRDAGYAHFGMVTRRADDAASSLLENRYLAPYWAKVVDRTRHAPVFVDEKDIGLRIMKHLRENGIVLVSLDAPFSYHLMTRPFLGGERAFPVGFLRIVQATGAAVVPMMCIGTSSRFQVRFGEAVNLRDAPSRDEFLKKNIDILVKVLESQILEEPSHWLLI